MARQAGSAYVEFSARTAGVVTGMEKARAATRAASRQMRDDIREAQASIGLLGEEVGVKLPRHLRTFVAELPGVSAAMAAAFNGTAIIGLGMIAVEQGKKIYEFVHSLEEMGEKANEAFEKLHQTTSLTTDDLIKANTQMENAIAKFEGRKENKLAVQLAEAASEAANLAKQLQSVADQEMKVFGDEGVSWMKGKGAGMLPTGDLLDHVKQFNKERAAIEDETAEKIRAARDAGNEAAAKDAEAERDKQLAAKYDTEMAWATKTMTDLQKLQTRHQAGAAVTVAPGLTAAGLFADPTQAILLMTKHMSSLNDATRLQSELARSAADHIKQMGETGDSAAERQRKAAEEAAKALREQLKAEQERLKFRDEMVKNYAQGQAADRAELQRGADLAEKLAAKTTADIKQAQKEQADAIGAAQKTRRSNAEEYFQEQAQMEASAVELGQETNAQRIDHLRAALNERLRLTKESLDQEAAAYSGYAEKQEEIQQDMSKALIEYNRETAALNRESLESGIGGAMLEMERRAKDTASQLREIFTSTISGINDQLANLMTGQRTNWKQMFSGIASQTAHAGLTAAEGLLVKGIKPDGSSQKPFYVKLVDDIKKAGSDIAGVFKGSPDANTGAGNMGFIHSAFGFVQSFFGGLMPHASGGPVMPGGAYLVGERGPEPFFPGVSGTIGTNAAMRRSFGGGPVTNIHMGGIDARGASDPAGVNAAVHRAMRQYIPTMVGASSMYQQDQKRRVPPLTGNGA